MRCTTKPRGTMGQSASRPPVKSLKGKDLFQLKEFELGVLIDMSPWTKDEILLVTRSLKEKLAQDDALPGFYSIEDDSPEINLAVRVNALSKDVAHLRFKMVPSRVKEPLFWKSVIIILKDRLVEYNARHQLEEEEKEEDKDGMDQRELISNGHENGSTNMQTLHAKSTTPCYPDDEMDEESVDGQEGQTQISVLQRRIKELERALKNNGIKVPHHQTSSLHQHKGEWIMTKDSADFLSYPPELKENMRREKQKRLHQVQQDMKFILETDDISDTNGRWECCGQTMYHSDCGKTKR